MSDISSNTLIELAIDLTKSLSTEDRFSRLLTTIRNTITCDAVAILLLQNGQLKPLGQMGLVQDVLGRRFQMNEHPRFQEIAESSSPIRFASDCPLPDPYDGMLLSHEGDLPVHACMGFPLRVDNKLLGILTLDSMTPCVFDEIPKRTLDIISAMSAATLKTATLIEQLESASRHNQQVVSELTEEAFVRDGGELIGSSSAMEKLRREIALVAPSDFTVLIEGETGVGKELVARTLHRQSNRHKQALVYVNCAAIPENLIESELFGHVKGAFTGADKDRTGKFSLANRGTLFLDEIGELPLAAQSKLLRALQNQEIQPVGQDNTEILDVRVIAATNRNLEQEVEAGHFRADLFHRLSVYPISIAPLNKHKEDIDELAGFFTEQVRRKLGFQQLILHPKVIPLLRSYNWPGNIREFEHAIQRAALKASARTRSGIIEIKRNDFDITLSNTLIDNNQPTSLESEFEVDATQTLKPESNHYLLEHRQSLPCKLKEASENFQRNLILSSLEKAQGNWAEAARSLQTDRANLNRLAKRLGIEIKKKIVG